MKSIIVTTFTILICTQIFAGGIKFHKGDWASALEAAQAQDKLIFMDCYTTWCGPCKSMAKNVFTNEKVGQYFNKNFINVKMDMEKGEGRKLAQQYKVRAYPTLLFVDGSGKIVHQGKGAQPADRFISLGTFAIKKFDKSIEYTEMYEGGKRDADFLLKYAYSLKRANKSNGKVVNEYLATQSDLTTPKNLKALFDLTQSVDSKVFQLMTKHKAAIIASGDYDNDDFSEKVVNAANSTVDKAIEFSEASLVKEAKSAVKKHAPEVAAKFTLQADMNYAAGTNNENAFFKAANKYVKKHVKNNALELNKASMAVLEICKDKKNLAKAEKWAKKAVDNGGLAEYYLTYSLLLAKQDKTTDALKFAKKGRTVAKESKKSTVPFERLIEQLKAKA